MPCRPIIRLRSRDVVASGLGWGLARQCLGTATTVCGGGVAVARFGWVGEFRDELVENRDELVVWRDETGDRIV